jgi:multidrug efflux system membrane fusion protein
MPPIDAVNSSEVNKAAVPASVDSRGESSGKSRWWIWVVILGVVALGWWYFRSRGTQANGASTAAGAPAGAAARSGPSGSFVVPVVVATAHKGDLPVYFNGLGTVTAFNTVTVKSRVDGQIVKVNFTEGQYVKEGDSLIEIDPRPFQVQLEQADGQLAKDQAQLRDVQVDYERYQLLYKEGVIPKQQLDSQQAQVGQYEGAIKADQAQIDNAKLQITYSHIVAPISGRVGLRLVDVGNIVHAADTNGLVVITQLQPISVIFTLPQDQLPKVMEQMRNRTMTVEAYDRDNTDKIATGKLLTIDNQIDTTTGTYKLKAVFDNSKNELFPNQFVNMHLLVDTKRNVILVPTTAILRGPKGTYVFAVAGNNKVSVKNVTVAETTGNVSGITTGLGDGETVVIDGQDKLQEGSQVEPRQAARPSGGGTTQSSFLPDGSTPGAPRGGPGR